MIKEWNETNFNLDLYPYVREAYDKKKYAFVTDVVRLYALYNEGGIYMDTDVELLSSLNPFLKHHAFSGFESPTQAITGIIASEKGGRWAKENLEYYDGKHFLKPDGKLDQTTNVEIITKYMVQTGLKLNNQYQDIKGLITLYANDYFCPKSLKDGKIYLTPRSVTIHHFNGSWQSPFQKFKEKIAKLIGPKLRSIIISIIHR